MRNSRLTFPGGYTWLGDTLVLFSRSEDGKSLAVSVAKEDGQFQGVIVADGPAPSARVGFSCSPLDDTHIIIVGGDGDDVMTAEIWVFNASDCSFMELTTVSEPIKRRSCHCTIASNGVCYLFGGKNRLELCQDLLVISVDLESRSFIYKSIQAQDNWPCSRIGASMTRKGETAWLFGGKGENGVARTDIWCLDFSLMPSFPSWEAVDLGHAQKMPGGHVAWFKNNFMIAGVADDIPHLGSVWSYDSVKGKWTIVNVFEENEICAREGGDLLNIHRFPTGIGLKKIVLMEPFQVLDRQFRKLVARQEEFTMGVDIDSQTETAWDTMYRRVKEQVSLCEEMKAGNVTHDARTSICRFFSEDYRAMLAKGAREYTEKAALDTARVVTAFPSCLSMNPGIEPMETHSQVARKLEQSKATLHKLQKERSSEIVTLKKHLAEIAKGVGAVQMIDSGDFGTFTSATMGFSREKRSYALDLFYEMQQREYQALLEKRKMIRKKIERKEWQCRVGRVVTENLEVKQAVSDIKWWNQQLEILRADSSAARDFIGTMRRHANDRHEVGRQIDNEQHDRYSVKRAVTAEIKDWMKRMSEISALVDTMSSGSDAA